MTKTAKILAAVSILLVASVVLQSCSEAPWPQNSETQPVSTVTINVQSTPSPTTSELPTQEVTTTTTSLGESSPTLIISFSPKTAGSGDSVQIKGSDLGSVTGVFFGDVPAQKFAVVTGAQDTLIVAVVGAGSNGSVTLVHPAGRSSLDGFTFIPGQKPTSSTGSTVTSTTPRMTSTTTSISTTTVTPTPTATASRTLFADSISQYQVVDERDLVRNPSRYMNQKIQLAGKVNNNIMGSERIINALRDEYSIAGPVVVYCGSGVPIDRNVFYYGQVTGTRQMRRSDGVLLEVPVFDTIFVEFYDKDKGLLFSNGGHEEVTIPPPLAVFPLKDTVFKVNEPYRVEWSGPKLTGSLEYQYGGGTTPMYSTNASTQENYMVSGGGAAGSFMPSLSIYRSGIPLAKGICSWTINVSLSKGYVFVPGNFVVSTSSTGLSLGNNSPVEATVEKVRFTYLTDAGAEGNITLADGVRGGSRLPTTLIPNGSYSDCYRYTPEMDGWEFRVFKAASFDISFVEPGSGKLEKHTIDWVAVPALTPKTSLPAAYSFNPSDFPIAVNYLENIYVTNKSPVNIVIIQIRIKTLNGSIMARGVRGTPTKVQPGRSFDLSTPFNSIDVRALAASVDIQITQPNSGALEKYTIDYKGGVKPYVAK